MYTVYLFLTVFDFFRQLCLSNHESQNMSNIGKTLKRTTSPSVMVVACIVVIAVASAACACTLYAHCLPVSKTPSQAGRILFSVAGCSRGGRRCSHHLLNTSLAHPAGRSRILVPIKNAVVGIQFHCPRCVASRATLEKLILTTTRKKMQQNPHNATGMMRNFTPNFMMFLELQAEVGGPTASPYNTIKIENSMFSDPHLCLCHREWYNPSTAQRVQSPEGK